MKNLITKTKLHAGGVLESLYPWRQTNTLPRVLPASQPRQLGQLLKSYDSNDPLITDFFSALYRLNQRYHELKKRGWLQTLWMEKPSLSPPLSSSKNIISLVDRTAKTCHKIFE